MAVAEPGVNPFAIGHRAGGGQVALFMDFGELSHDVDFVFPEQVAIGGAESRDGKEDLRVQLPGTRTAQRSLTRRNRIAILYEGRVGPLP